MPGRTKRAYDATRRRERAEQERQATRRRVVVAATSLFIEQGYTATTMTQIAEVAGVALQSVYKVGGSKAELVHLARDVAVAGDDQTVMLVDRADYDAVRNEPDPARQIAMFSALIATTLQRVAPIWPALQEAAAADATAAANLRSAHESRLDAFRNVIDAIPRRALRESPAKSAETAWAIASPDSYLLQTSILGWTPGRYQTWLANTLTAVLLRPEPDVPTAAR